MSTEAIRKSNPLIEKLGYTADLIYELVVADIKIKYKKSILGLVWSMLNPLAQLLVYQFVFGTIFPLSTENYATYLFVGILSFGWFQQTLSTITDTIVGNRSLVKRPGFPTAILPVVTATTQLIHFLLALPVLFLILYFDGIQMGRSLAALPLVIGLQFLFSIGLGYFSASIYVKFRDIKYLIDIALRLFFFLTPIIYSIDLVPARFLPIYKLNPLTHFIDAFRVILMQNSSPDFRPLFFIFAFTLPLLWAGYYFFVRSAHEFVEEI